MGGKQKIGIVGFDRAFHGRTLASQQAGGMAGQKFWIVNLDPAIINAPFPDGYWQPDTTFQTFLEAISRAGLKSENIAGVIMESFQGVGPDFAPVEYVRELADWCQRHQVVLVFDEVQAGFGRSGKFWVSTLRSGSRPHLLRQRHQQLAAALGRYRSRVGDEPFRPRFDDQHAYGQSRLLCRGPSQCDEDPGEKPTENAAALGPVLLAGLKRIQARHPEFVGRVSGAAWSAACKP